MYDNNATSNGIEEGYVDIYGRPLHTTVYKETGEEAVPLTELKLNGGLIFHKARFAKLQTIEKNFDDDFYTYMLDSAKLYMTKNKINFSEEQILKSIDNCKRELLKHEKPSQAAVKEEPKDDFFRERIIEGSSDTDISVKFSNSSASQNFGAQNPFQPSSSAVSDGSRPARFDSQYENPTSKWQASPPKFNFNGKNNGNRYNASSRGKPFFPNKSFNGNGFKQDEQGRRNQFHNKSYHGHEFDHEDTRKTHHNHSHGSRLDEAGKPHYVHNKANHSHGFEQNDDRKTDGRAYFPNKSNNANGFRHNNENIKEEKEDNWSFRDSVKPQVKVLDSVVLDQQKQKTLCVVVACIEKQNIFWARDKANDEIFEKIYRMVREEARVQKTASQPLQFEKVYITEDNGDWFRCKVVLKDPLIVHFLDYGNVKTVKHVKEVSQDLAKIPCMAVRMSFRENYRLEPKNELEIKILNQNEDGTYFVKILSKSEKPESSESDDWDSPEPTPKLAPKKPDQFFDKPRPLCFLESGLKVAIIHVHEEHGTLYLRTREGFQKLKEIEEEIRNYARLASPIQNPAINQLVLLQDRGKFHRGVIIDIKNQKYCVELLDYVRTVAVNSNDLRSISESLSKAPITYIPGEMIRGYENAELDENCKKFIATLIEKRTKYKVVLEEDFDLFDGTDYLSVQLKHLNPKPLFTLKDIKCAEPKLAELDSYMCGFYGSTNEIFLSPLDLMSEHLDDIVVPELEDKDPYSPQIGEICHAYYIDQWYRGIVKREFSPKFEIFLLDFGNTDVFETNLIRRINPKVLKIPALALPCRLIGIPNDPTVEAVVKKHLNISDVFGCEFVSITGGKWNVQIPKISEVFYNKQLA